jgi:hypothetical protein
VVRKTYRDRRGGAAKPDPFVGELVTVAELDSQLEAEVVAALADEGGFKVTVRSLVPWVVAGAESQRGRHLVLARSTEAAEVRRYLDEHGAQIDDDPQADELNWKGAVVAIASFVPFCLVVAIGGWLWQR